VDAVLLDPFGIVYYYGRMIKNTLHGVEHLADHVHHADQRRCWSPGTSRPAQSAAGGAGVDPAYSNMEGKEVRIGIYNSAAWANDVTDTAEGANNCQHDSMTPMAGFMLLFNMHMGEVIFGGIGSGLYTMLVFIFVSVFLAGLMIGRTPEYLGKKIDSYGVKCCAAVSAGAGHRRGGIHRLGRRPGWGQTTSATTGRTASAKSSTPTAPAWPTTARRWGVRLLADHHQRRRLQTVYASTMFNWTQTYCMLFGRYFGDRFRSWRWPERWRRKRRRPSTSAVSPWSDRRSSCWSSP
jgi:hypothetical protein